MPEEDAEHRCAVCGTTFDSPEAVREHRYDQGLLR
jgi:hypothetical protein